MVVVVGEDTIIMLVVGVGAIVVVVVVVVEASVIIVFCNGFLKLTSETGNLNAPDVVGNLNDGFEFVPCCNDFHPDPSDDIVLVLVKSNAIKRIITVAMRSFTPHPFRKAPKGTVRLLCVAGSVYCIQTRRSVPGRVTLILAYASGVQSVCNAMLHLIREHYPFVG